VAPTPQNLVNHGHSLCHQYTQSSHLISLSFFTTFFTCFFTFTCFYLVLFSFGYRRWWDFFLPPPHACLNLYDTHLPPHTCCAPDHTLSFIRNIITFMNPTSYPQPPKTYTAHPLTCYVHNADHPSHHKRSPPMQRAFRQAQRSPNLHVVLCVRVPTR
jgi:hypothetical protein